MTVPTSSAPAAGQAPPPDAVTLTIDGVTVSVPKGTLIIRAAEQAGIEIPRFCDHPGLDPVGACRQCLVDVAAPRPDGTLAPFPKPQASCTMTVSPGMVVNTQHTSPVADKAQQGVMEFLLINHPLDCPVCDKGGECPLQNQAMSNGRAQTRFADVKRTFTKPVNISTQVLLDRERCVLCQRCTRFSDQVAGDKFINLVERGAMQQIGIYEDEPFESYFSGNTVQICPVGALTGARYRFRSRPFDLVSTPSTCEHCASGCAIRTDHRRGVVLRRMAIDDPEVNGEWSCDKGRWAFQSATLPDRLELPLLRQPDGSMRAVGWPEALAAAAAGLQAANGVGVLVGGRVSAEDAYAYGKFARIALGTNDIDFRARPHSAAEVAFLAEHVVATGPGGGAVTYADLRSAKAVVLAGFEPEEESPIVFLRLRRAVRKAKTAVYAVAPFATRGLEKLSGTLVPAAPGAEAAALADPTLTSALSGGGIVLVGERLATSPGALAAAVSLAASTGARLAWIPRRAGERGALEAGALGALLPGGRPVTDAAARGEVAAVWEVASLPATPGRDTAGIVSAAASGDLGALVVGGVDPGDLALPQVSDALAKAFVVSLEIRESAVTAVADVVLPVAPHAEKAGSFVNWEGRVRPFEAALTTNSMSDHRVLDMLAAELGVFLETRTQEQINDQFEALGPWTGARATSSGAANGGGTAYGAGDGDVVLATWPLLLDRGRMQDGEPFLAGTARASVARVGAALAARLAVVDGDEVTVSSGSGSVSVPVLVTDGMVDGVVWLPTNSLGCAVRSTLGVDAGARVTVTKGGAR
ncbi:MAG: NADH-quinone oxidoreductase subunit G [Actinomycetales bacterium]|nr:NADH-quinone oxidoreductase subunit G [Candidatus Phosphoribacter baldrii]